MIEYRKTKDGGQALVVVPYQYEVIISLSVVTKAINWLLNRNDLGEWARLHFVTDRKEFIPFDNAFTFKDEDSAVLFKLTWGGDEATTQQDVHQR